MNLNVKHHGVTPFFVRQACLDSQMFAKSTWFQVFRKQREIRSLTSLSLVLPNATMPVLGSFRRSSGDRELGTFGDLFSKECHSCGLLCATWAEHGRHVPPRTWRGTWRPVPRGCISMCCSGWQRGTEPKQIERDRILVIIVLFPV